MQTSNKILLGVFLATVLILTSIHIALYAKYKSGDFVKQIAAERDKTISMPLIKHVSVTGLVNVELFTKFMLNQTGKPEMKVENRPNSRFAYRIAGDTLLLFGDSTAGKDAYEKGARNHQLVQLSLPDAQNVKLAYGTLLLFGGLDSANAPSYSIELARHAHLGVIKREPASSPVFFNRMDLIINSSNVELEENTTVKELNVRAQTSDLFFRQTTIGHISLDVDSTTTVTLLGKNLKDAKIITKP